MPISLQQFADRLVQSGLFSAEELGRFHENFPADKRPQQAQDLARELILADRLTRFQAGAVYQGRLKGLGMGEYVVLTDTGGQLTLIPEAFSKKCGSKNDPSRVQSDSSTPIMEQ